MGTKQHKNPKEREGADERRVKKIERSKIKYQRQKENNLKYVRVRTGKTNAKSYMCIQAQACTLTLTLDQQQSKVVSCRVCMQRSNKCKYNVDIDTRK